MIELTDELLISQGKNRKCYQHPLDDRRCIKVLHEHSPIKTQLRETRYFKHLSKRKVDWHMVTPLLELVPTNRGLGAVFELVRDFNGNISKTLDYYLKLNDAKLDAFAIREIEHLKNYLWREGIIFRDLNPLNILLQDLGESDYRLMVVDGIGHNDFLPLCNYSLHLSRNKIMRTWNRKFNNWFGCYDSIIDSIKSF